MLCWCVFPLAPALRSTDSAVELPLQTPPQGGAFLALFVGFDSYYDEVQTLASLVAVATIAVTLAATATDASAYWRGRGWGPGIAAGVIGGAVVAHAIIASRPPGYVVYPSYAHPVYGPDCFGRPSGLPW